MKANPIVRAVMIDVGRVRSRAAAGDRVEIAVDRALVGDLVRAVDLAGPVAISVAPVDLKTVAVLVVAGSSVDPGPRVDVRKIVATTIAIKVRVRLRSLAS